MTRTLVWAILAMSVVVLAWAGHRWGVARAEAGVAIRQLSLVSADAKEIAAIKSSAPAESRRPRPAPGLAARVADAVFKAGLPQSAFQNFSPETESAIGTSGLRRQTGRVTLDGLTLPGLGRFLQEWRTAQPLWTVVSIDVLPTAAKIAAKPGEATDRPLKAVLGIETVFAGNEGTR